MRILGSFTVYHVYWIDWMKICEKASDCLLSASCDELLDNNNELASKGKKELLCLAGPLAGYVIADLSGLTSGFVGKYL